MQYNDSMDAGCPLLRKAQSKVAPCFDEIPNMIASPIECPPVVELPDHRVVGHVPQCRNKERVEAKHGLHGEWSKQQGKTIQLNPMNHLV
jgi:hypothetical protein